jgi:PPK2 family polyphosphate:nucleotide phosphotransferase
MAIKTKHYRVDAGEDLDLKERATREAPVCGTRKALDAQLALHVAQMTRLQAKLYAADTRAVLLVLQGMDAAGKDGVIKHVMSGLNPQGCQVTSFKQPTAEELRHDFLWRAARALPARGMIGIFNRSHYEEVLILRVHPELLAPEGLGPDERRKAFWRDRYRSIRDFEVHLERNGTTIVKVFLNLSKEEQRKRFLDRIDDPQKNWKLSTADVEERGYWDRYQKVYAQALEATATKAAPWYVVPADDKESARLIVSQILLDTLEGLDLKWPRATPEHHAELIEVRDKLTAGG